MKPSDFNAFPSNSVIGSYEYEEVARNIMLILARTGDTFRYLEWDEYRLERQNDGHFTENEQIYFDRIVGYCLSHETAVLFSPVWAGAE